MAPIPHPERRSGSASILPSCIGLVVALAFLAVVRAEANRPTGVKKGSLTWCR